jgi:hypothetical protein
MSASDHGAPEDFEALARALEERVATVHERVACTTCGLPIGQRCRRIPPRRRSPGRSGLTIMARAGTTLGAELKHPHVARQRADGIYER